jgi:hypothetical protein
MGKETELGFISYYGWRAGSKEGMTGHLCLSRAHGGVDRKENGIFLSLLRRTDWVQKVQGHASAP